MTTTVINKPVSQKAEKSGKKYRPYGKKNKKVFVEFKPFEIFPYTM